MKSAATFLRQQLKVKGKTQHNGRGCYEMTSTEVVSFDTIVDLVKEKEDKWIAKGIVTSVVREVKADSRRELVIHFNEEMFGSYRTFETYDVDGWNMFGYIHYSCPTDMNAYMDRFKAQMGGE